MPGRSKHRLSVHVRPQSAELRFTLDPRRSDFRGEASYAIHLDRATRLIELHAADLVVARVVARANGLARRGRVDTDAGHERIRLRFDRPLPRGPIRLELAFRGRVRRDLRGLYRSADDETPWLATQLCPTDARRLFPAFDEPGIKLRYRIAATVPTDATVLSNAPIEFEEASERGIKTVHFEPTPPLSAYLVALAVGPFEAGPALQMGPTPVRVYTLPGRQTLASFARETAAEALGRIERWFEIPHPYAKLDLVALPDFAFGAMENAGAVFFRDSVLLLDASTASPEELMRSAETITHELAHMWFGNLVTMAWWNDLWLNESFATWMAYEILDGWQPDWRVWQAFAHRREEALEQDALSTSHPIAPRVRSAEDAQENFDAITYTKGACVLRMLEQYLGRERFREGVQLYLRRHREQAATAEDLWHALSEVADQPIGKIVAPWTLQTGFPLVRIERHDDGAGDRIRLSQTRFLAGGRPTRRDARAGTRATRVREAVRWPIPWVGRVGRGDDGNARAVRHLFAKAHDRAPGQGAALTWIYGNAGEAGFFRVRHGDSEWRDLLEARASLSPLERIGLVGHQWALARAGEAPLSALLDLVASLGDETEPDVLAAVERVLAQLLQRVTPGGGRRLEARLRAWIEVYFGGQVDALGLDPDRTEERAHGERRARVVSIVGELGRCEAIGMGCEARARDALAGRAPLPPALADAIVRIAAGRGDRRLHAACVDAARKAETPQARRRWLFALAAFRGAAELEASLGCARDRALAPGVDRAGLWIALLDRPETAEAAWEGLQRGWKGLAREWPPILQARVAAACGAALPPDRGREIAAFFRAHPLDAGRRTLQQVQEALRLAASYQPRLQQELETYLGQPVPDRPAEPTRPASGSRARSRAGGLGVSRSRTRAVSRRIAESVDSPYFRSS
ncbi:MAG: M1 family metallopeptidase [Myxococcota bacterium]